ncbi:ribonuclease HII [Chitinophagaceae bacterium IBVUCB1]|nr:ribonuclease HII [Chitinophagaceae bacterium IBVUCB1]
MLKAYYQQSIIEAGCDEAGRGCLAGPVFAAAVILPTSFHHPLLNDSKKLSEKDRNILRPIIEANAIAWAVAQVSETEIDDINILKASFKAMHHAIDALSVKPTLLLIDGNRFSPYFGIPHQCIVGGDGKYAAIAAASILAKTHRDEYMLQIDTEFPAYGWKDNKGYGTGKHLSALKEIGMCRHHRKTFKWDKTV